MTSREELLALFQDHYWDSFEPNKDLVMAHVRGVLALVDTAQGSPEPRLAERLADVVMMLNTPDAYNREYIAVVCRSILSSVTSTNLLPVITKGLVPDPNSASGFSVSQHDRGEA